ncbi:hypothetical protein B0H11DRAFT_1899127 [Mycena galericulata]|nr:hypothetical protein B0H11DRAFT_1899127 [Mycena galericulata]
MPVQGENTERRGFASSQHNSCVPTTDKDERGTGSGYFGNGKLDTTPLENDDVLDWDPGSMIPGFIERPRLERKDRPRNAEQHDTKRASDNGKSLRIWTVECSQLNARKKADPDIPDCIRRRRRAGEPASPGPPGLAFVRYLGLIQKIQCHWAEVPLHRNFDPYKYSGVRVWDTASLLGLIEQLVLKPFYGRWLRKLGIVDISTSQLPYTFERLNSGGPSNWPAKV